MIDDADSKIKCKFQNKIFGAKKNFLDKPNAFIKSLVFVRAKTATFYIFFKYVRLEMFVAFV
jgi:hypothetical protein